MKRIFLLLLSAALLFCLACGTKEPAATASPAPEATAEPDAPVVFEISPEAQPAETVSPAGFTGLMISDGDVEITLEELAEQGEFSVYPVTFDTQILYYIFPAEVYVSNSGTQPDIGRAVGAVVMTYANDAVSGLTSQVFLGQLEAYSDQVQDLFCYFRDTFPLMTVIGVTEGSWAALSGELDMSFETALSSAQSGLESREIYGQFVYHISESVVSFDFYSA